MSTDDPHPCRHEKSAFDHTRQAFVCLAPDCRAMVFDALRPGTRDHVRAYNAAAHDLRPMYPMGPPAIPTPTAPDLHVGDDGPTPLART